MMNKLNDKVEGTLLVKDATSASKDNFIRSLQEELNETKEKLRMARKDSQILNLHIQKVKVGSEFFLILIVIHNIIYTTL